MVEDSLDQSEFSGAQISDISPEHPLPEGAGIMTLSHMSVPLALLSAALVLGGCHSNSNQQADAQSSNDQMSATAPSHAGGAKKHEPHDKTPANPTPHTPPPPAVIELPAGTEIPVRLDQDLSSNESRPGESFSATVTDDVTVNGTVVIPRDSRADGTVTDAKALGKFKGGALLAVKLDRVHTNWGTYPVDTASLSKAENGKGKRTTGIIAGGAGLGALIGGLAGGGKGAAIGALAGGGAGTAGAAFTGNKPIVLPAETQLTFKLQNSVQITESNSGSGDPQLQ